MTVSAPASSSPIQTLVDSVNGSRAEKKSTTAMDDAESRFLKLLTTQLKNQDPLNPMDNAQMTSQLAQISAVNGIEKLNATLEKLLSSSADSQAMQAAALVGRQIMIEGNGLELTDAGAVSGLQLGTVADSVVVTIKDANGLPVRVFDLGDLDAGTHNFTWDGKTDSGAQAVNGHYSIQVQAKRGAEKVDATALQLAPVISINRSGQNVSLDLGRLGLATMSDVKQIF